MCRKWVRFVETVTMTILHRLAVLGENRDEGVYDIYYTIRSDRILFYTFPCIFSQPTRIPNDCKRSGLQLLLYKYIHILLLYTHRMYRRPFGCTKESIFMGFYYTLTDVRVRILFSGNLSSDNIRVFNWIRIMRITQPILAKKPPLHYF